jgi:nucleoside-diphosphate-sugar epimerase
MKILLIGATGQIGFALTHALAKAGHEVTVLVRSAGQLCFPRSVRVVTAPAFTEATFASLLPGMDCAIYGVGLPEQFTFDSGIFEQVNFKLLQSFLAAMEKSTLRRLVYISTYEVFAAKDGLIRESHPLSGLDGLTPYFHAMNQAYTAASAFALRTGTALTTIHPAAVYGGLNTSEGFTNVIENLLNWRLWKLPVVPRGRFPLVHADSLVTAIVGALNHEGAYIVSDGMASLKSLARALRSQTRSYVPPEVPAALAYAATAPVEALGRALHFRPMLCKVQLDFITNGTEPLAQRAAQTLGWTPLRLEDGLRRYLSERTQLLATRMS